ncbi:MAG: fumarylacetoacetate hydrolase family protein [Crocinitomicaceae bacterium]
MKIICIGRNYAKHAAEMNADLPSSPVFFMKPDSAINRFDYMFIPNFTNNLHYEVELVVKICKVGKHIDLKFANKYYEEIGLGIDFTARDKQAECKEKRLPWEIAKGFDNSALISNSFIHKSELDLESINFRLEKNKTIVQTGVSNDMIFTIDSIISYISQFMTLKTGDLIFTGTPEGVGPVTIGDELQGYIGDEQMFTLRIK